MGTILVVAEIQKGKVREASLELVAFARKVAEGTNREVTSLVIGQGVSGQAEELAKKGGGEVYLAEHEQLANYNVDAYFAAAKAAIDAASPDVILLSNTPSGWDLAPRIAAALDAGFASDCFNVEVEGGDLLVEQQVCHVEVRATGAARAPHHVGEVRPLVGQVRPEAREHRVTLEVPRREALHLLRPEADELV